VALNAPRYALPIGVRAVDTITASRTDILISSNEQKAEPFGRQRGLFFALDLNGNGVT